MRTSLKVVGVLLIVVVLALVWVANNLGGLVKKGVETYAPPVLGTAVVLDSATIMPFSSAGSVNGLAIAQPAGFGVGNAIELGEASLGVDLGSLRAEPLVVQRILVRHGVSRDLGASLLDDIKRCIDHFGKHPVSVPLNAEEGTSYHH